MHVIAASGDDSDVSIDISVCDACDTDCLNMFTSVKSTLIDSFVPVLLLVLYVTHFSCNIERLGGA